MTYKEVVEKAKKTLEKRGEYNDGKVFLNACSLWLKGDQINLWSYWQGYQMEDIDKGVDILLVGQDWGNPEWDKKVADNIAQIQEGKPATYFGDKLSTTDNNLIKLFKALGCDICKKDPGKRLLFTNYCLGYRKTKQSGGMTQNLLSKDKELFDDLVKAVKPRVIICLGKMTYEAVTGQKVGSFTEQLKKGIPYVTTYPGAESIKVYGVAHCGGMGSANVGGMNSMLKAWKKIAVDLCKNIEIREVELSDTVLNRLISFSEDWAAENSCYGYRANDRSDIEGNRIFFAEEEGKVVGYLFGKVYESENMQAIMPKGTPYFEVEELYVSPEQRSRGIGESLFRYAENAVKNEAEYMVLSTATKNWKAIFHFYLDELDMRFWSARLFKKIEE